MFDFGCYFIIISHRWHHFSHFTCSYCVTSLLFFLSFYIIYFKYVNVETCNMILFFSFHFEFFFFSFLLKFNTYTHLTLKRIFFIANKEFIKWKQLLPSRLTLTWMRILCFFVYVFILIKVLNELFSVSLIPQSNYNIWKSMTSKLKY